MATCKQGNTNIFTCPICLEIIKSPKSLPCLHSFCEQCICENIVKLNTKETEQIKHYRCPVCRTVITPTNPEVDVSKWAALLPTNVTLISLMDVTDDRDKQECNPCKRRSQSSIGIFWCRDCMERMCQNCSDYHSSIKSLVNHRVTKIENDDASLQGIDLNAISEMCPVHSSKVIEAFCFDHKKLCCFLCLTSEHRKCDDVKTIEEISAINTDETNSLNTMFTTTMSTINELISEKQKEIKQFDVSAKTSEAKACEMVACAKDKLDRLLLSFSKELSILEDGEKIKLEDDICVLNKLLENVCYLSKVTALVLDQGSAIKQFIQRERAKLQFADFLVVIKDTNRIQRQIEITFSSQLENIENISGIGTFSIASSSETNKKQFRENIDQHIKKICEFWGLFSLKQNSTFKKYVGITGKSFVCGVSISEQIIIIGNNDNPNMYVFNIATGSIKYVCQRNKGKRIAFNKQRKEIYFSCISGNFVKFTVSSETLIERIGFQSSNIGGITLFENFIYIIVENEIRKFRVDANVKSFKDMVTCFQTNTDCSDDVLNGLAIDPKNGHMIYTSIDKEIIGTTLEGKQLFCVKDKRSIKNPTSVTVHSSGYILVGSETGSVHVISPDGNHHWPLIEKCKQIKRLCDIWLDPKEQTLFLCGDEYIEMYDIMPEFHFI